MQDYLKYKFEDSEAFVNTFDELPLWSASFGLLLFRHLELKPNLLVLDIGSGAGFPLLELAGRLGNSCKIFGLDPWTNANKRAEQKIVNYGYSNVETIEGSAAEIPFDENKIDLIVSNLGINNFENPAQVFGECYRVLKTGGKLAITTNMFGHWKEFYEVFYTSLKQIGKTDLIPIIEREEAHRGKMLSITKLFTDAGFSMSKQKLDSFDMKFLDGTAFLNHHFVKLGWLSNWMSLFPRSDLPAIFSALEENLNLHAGQHGALNLSVPMAYFEGQKR